MKQILPQTLIHLLTFVALITIGNLQMQAQSKWKRGYVIQKNGDSLVGKIAYRDNAKSPRSIAFKKKNGVKVIYKPSDLKLISVKTEFQEIYLKSFVVDLDYSATALEGINNSPVPDLVKDTVFAQLIVSGTRQLYYFKDNKTHKKHFVIEPAPGKAVELICKRYYVNSERTLLAYNEEYKKQLLNYLPNCVDIDKKINATKFTEGSIINLLKEYDQCNEPENKLKYEFKREKSKALFGLTIGFNSTNLRVSSNSAQFNQLNFSKSVGVNAGIFLNIILPNTEKRWSIYNELLFTQYDLKSSGYYIYYEDYDWYKKVTDAEIKATYLKLITALRFQYPYYKVKPFIQMGIGNGYAVKSNSTSNYETRFISNIQHETVPLLDFRKYEQSLCFGIGAAYKSIGVELRAELGNGMSQMSGVSTRTSLFYFLIHYKL